MFLKPCFCANCAHRPLPFISSQITIDAANPQGCPLITHLSSRFNYICLIISYPLSVCCAPSAPHIIIIRTSSVLSIIRASSVPLVLSSAAMPHPAPLVFHCLRIILCLLYYHLRLLYHHSRFPLSSARIAPHMHFISSAPHLRSCIIICASSAPLASLSAPHPAPLVFILSSAPHPAPLVLSSMPPIIIHTSHAISTIIVCASNNIIIPSMALINTGKNYHAHHIRNPSSDSACGSYPACNKCTLYCPCMSI